MMEAGQVSNFQTPSAGGERNLKACGYTERLPVQTVERLHRLLGGEAHIETMALRFIADKYGAKSLLYLPPHVVKEMLKRPADFLRAVKQHCEPELLAEGRDFFNHG